VILGAVLLWSAGIAGMPAAAVAAAAATPATATATPATPELYRLDLGGNTNVWAQDKPQSVGTSIVFHRYPDGALMSIKASDVKRISISKAQPTSKGLAPGQQVDIGMTGPGAPGKGGGSAAGARGQTAPPGPGERKDGSALFNPNRGYRPDWDSKQVPGMNIGNPNSPNDYQEGRTFAFPAAASPSIAPGDLPRAKVETGDPKSNQ
jgi:hypothetical protein